MALPSKNHPYPDIPSSVERVTLASGQVLVCGPEIVGRGGAVRANASEVLTHPLA
jgi:hypothetical protein